jgi:hypothetical protein
MANKKDVDGRDKPGHDEDLFKRDYRFNFQTANSVENRHSGAREARARNP